MRPFRSFRHLTVERIGSDAKSSDGNEGVVLAVGESAARLRFEIVRLQTGLLDELLAIAGAFLISEIVVKQIVFPAEAVEQMTSGQIDIRFVIGVTPDVITYRRVHISLRCFEILPIAFDLVDESGLGDGQADFILIATLLRGRWRWICLERAHVEESLLPEIPMRCPGTLPELLKFLVGYVDPRVYAHQLRAQTGFPGPHQFNQRVLAF